MLWNIYIFFSFFFFNLASDATSHYHHNHHHSYFHEHYVAVRGFEYEYDHVRRHLRTFSGVSADG